ncbi:sulfite reductase subunit alpha [Hyphomicrobium sp. LHD-15]|uniref:sulfite reductase subunit alpha n=1 Tax=Hyphomicrobium sp. LHD-15 TaxID=3072142 RepID=UPI00280F12A5|nr:sulfite reductase subunit alpha [Hyphomicrobium sp. LHD-15]MDQ8698128.1 sulfite reductase subunit alpha [Hyphomicrobium sp. LHD-15]
MNLPFIPDDAPFTGDQKTWLAGYLAGLKSRLLDAASNGTASVGVAGQSAATAPLHILYGTQTGNAEAVANDMAQAAREAGFDPIVSGLDQIEIARLTEIERVVIVTSTYGEGEMPDNAQLFWDALAADTAPRLENLTFSVLALGDTAYDGFCQAGKLFDMRLEQLGARRVAPRADCDVDFEKTASAWIGAALPQFPKPEGTTAAPSAATNAAPKPAKSEWTRKNPYPAVLAVNRRLSGPKSGKDIRHYEFELGDSGLSYEAGDALGVMPVNNPALVSALLDRLGLSAEMAVGSHPQSLGEMLASSLEISTPSRELVSAIEVRGGDDALTHVVRHGDKEAMDAWLWSKDILDVLNVNPAVRLSADEFVSLLKPLQHRAYSISSSPLAHPGRVHLTIASVRWRSQDREHGGVCSTFLADRVGEGDKAGIFVSPNKAFRPPADNDAPMIMVGPGTGVAPFRAFLEQRGATGAKGRNWLFFGDQHRADDFVYEDELTAMGSNGLLTRLDLAFSRDQDEKIYVQTRMKENGRDLFAWLEEGAYFYVCGDASRMAKDVEDALRDVIATHGGFTPEAANDYVSNLRKTKRYLRDVY